jgi:hypothetical protein
LNPRFQRRVRLASLLDLPPGDAGEWNLGTPRPATAELTGHCSGTDVDESRRGRTLRERTKKSGRTVPVAGLRADRQVEGEILTRRYSHAGKFGCLALKAELDARRRLHQRQAQRDLMLDRIPRL